MNNNTIVVGLSTGGPTIDKPARQAALVQIIKKRAIRNQQEIVDLMRESGFVATQASISRDIRELGLIKLAGQYVQADGAVTGKPPRQQHPLAGLITGVEPVGANLIVVKTVTGAASSVGVVLDQELSADVAGTIAGDDTIFVAVRSRSEQGRVIATLNGWYRRDAQTAAPDNWN